MNLLDENFKQFLKKKHSQNPKHSVSNCSNKKCKSDRRKNIQTFDCGVLNEMIGREVCIDGNSLCKDCIAFYYKKTYEEILKIDQEREN